MPKQDLILLAMDASPSLDLMARALQSADFDISQAHDRASLEKSVQEAIPALLMIGEQLAGADGFALSADMLERFPTMPIILYGGANSADPAAKVIRTGISGYLRPPLKTDEVVDEVKRALSRARKLGDWVRREVKRTTASLEHKAKISEAERLKLEAIISNIQDGVLVLDEHHHILLANRTVIEMFRDRKSVV